MYLIVRSDRLSFAYTHEERGMMPQYLLLIGGSRDVRIPKYHDIQKSQLFALNTSSGRRTFRLFGKMVFFAHVRVGGLSGRWDSPKNQTS